MIEKIQQLFGPIRGQDQNRRSDRQFVCGQCGGNHPTSQCLPKPNYQKPEGRPALWCEFDKRWGNHRTEECYNRIRFMREHAMNQGNPRVGELPKPVLDRQPAPSRAAVRLFSPEEERGFEKALVPGLRRGIFLGRRIKPGVEKSTCDFPGRSV